jgi:hypothetical protein
VDQNPFPVLDVVLVPRGRVLGLGRGLGVPKAAQVSAAKAMKTKSNNRAGVDAGLAALFAFGHPWPGTTHHGRSP